MNDSSDDSPSYFCNGHNDYLTYNYPSDMINMSNNLLIKYNWDKKDLQEAMSRVPEDIGDDKEVIFIFPFPGGIDIEKAGRALSIYRNPHFVDDLWMDVHQVTKPFVYLDNGKQAYVTVLREDERRTKPGVYFNDNLIDFWMRW
jgi:hypothetical protein